MFSKHAATRAVLLVLVGGMALAGVVRAETRPILPVREPELSEIFIPAEVGYVVERHEPTAGLLPLTIIHIQEAHTNYGAQQHLVAILERLVERYGLTLVLVEGGQGDVSLSYMRRYGTQENRRRVADKYLKAGIISGEEYLDIVSDFPLTLWGVEPKDLYEQNLQAFLDTDGMAQRVAPGLAAVRGALEALTPRLANPALTRLEAQTKAFERDELGLADYAQRLAEVARQQTVPEDAYPLTRRFLEARRLEADIDLKQVPVEQQRLMTALARRVDAPTLDGLVAQALEMKAGKVTRGTFYTALEQEAGTAGLELASYPQLARYIRYAQATDAIQPRALSDELERLTRLVRERFAATPDGLQLGVIAEQLDLVEKLVALQLSPQDYERLQALDLPSALGEWERFLTERANRQGLTVGSFAGLGQLRVAVPALWRFYDVAGQRDQGLVDAAVAKLTESHERLAVLITGGFHSPNITRLLQERGVGVVVLAPKVDQPTDERLYRAVLKYKSGHGSFEEVMAIAEQEAVADSAR